MPTQHSNDPKGPLDEELAGSVEENTVDASEKTFFPEFRNYEKISRLSISKWEDFYHVWDPEEKREVSLVTLNREKYLQHFTYLIDQEGDWDSDREIPALAEKKFREVNEQFGKRYDRIQKIIPHTAFPRVIAVHKDAALNGQYYAILEYVAGVPFLIAARGLSPLQILGLMKELFEGLEHMHDNGGLLHRRIKSDNIFVRFEGKKPTARFSSWGLAVPVEEARGDRSGARHYVAPEVLLQGRVTQQADHWSMGSLLYQALTGEPPEPERGAADDLHELINIIREDKPPVELSAFRAYRNPPEKIANELKIDKLQMLLNELLKRNPEERLFKTDRAIIRFIEENWPKTAIGAPESRETFSISIDS